MNLYRESQIFRKNTHHQSPPNPIVPNTATRPEMSAVRQGQARLQRAVESGVSGVRLRGSERRLYVIEK
jgi:hypothetical protein